MMTPVISSREGALLTVTLSRPPANAIDETLVRALLKTIREAEADPDLRGLLITGAPGLFSAGLDVPRLVSLDRETMAGFWREFNDLLLALLDTPLVTMTAISGHAPAGGCVLAIMTDYRMMAEGPFKIGLNEVAVGIAMPRGVAEVFRSIVGHRRAERLGLTGALMDAQEALRIELVDELVAPEELMSRAKDRITDWMSRAPGAFEGTKSAFRQTLVSELRTSQFADEERFLDVWFSQESQAILHGLVASLKRPLKPTRSN